MNSQESNIQQELDRQHHRNNLELFAIWLGDNKFEFNGFNIWKQLVSENTYLFFSTDQLLDKFLGE